MDVRFFIWVTSDCNLSCRYCSQAYTMRYFSGYQMSIGEVDNIVDSCKERNIRFNEIELTGGEVSLWENLEYGVKKFSEICNNVTLVTNGNNPERIKALGLKTWIVSASQATKEQLSQYEGIPGVKFNTHHHKKLPDKPFDRVLPANCCVSLHPFTGQPQNALEYIQGRVYYCCDAFQRSEETGLTEDIFCDFGDDFLQKFLIKNYDQEICKYCLCNGKIWNQI